MSGNVTSFIILKDKEKILWLLKSTVYVQAWIIIPLKESYFIIYTRIFYSNLLIFTAFFKNIIIDVCHINLIESDQ